MANDIRDSLSSSPVDATSEQDRSANGRLESDPTVESSGQAATCEDPATSSSQGRKKPHKRTDRGRLHVIRHFVLSRFPLQALQSQGENIKQYRRLERRFREVLKPAGEIAGMLFDRFWSCYLRCVLAARLEASAFVPTASSTHTHEVVPALHERDVPTLVLPNGQEAAPIHETLPADLFHELVLIQRYDRHFSREMYRALSFLLVMRDNGEAGLQQYIEQILGYSKQ